VEAFRSGDVDFRAQITNLKKSGAEGIALPLLYKEMALIIKQTAEMGWKPYFIGGDGYTRICTRSAATRWREATGSTT
jgi:branched-chain amino acid transport system substrate-binding protein